MKKLALLLISVIPIAGCSTANPDAGHQCVWVEKPVFFGHGGVDANPVTTGLSYGALSSDAVCVNMLPQRVDMEFDDMMTKSGVPVNFHVVATFQITDSVSLVSKFGADEKDGQWGFWSRNVDQPLRTAVRDSVKKRDMQEMAIDQSAADAVGQEVSEAANKIVAQMKIPILFPQGGINVGRVMPPDAIKHQRIETAAQEQRAITEQQRKLAEDQRKAAELSRAAADNAYRQEMQLSPEQFIQLETIKMEYEVCKNQGACTLFIGGAPVPTLNTKR